MASAIPQLNAARAHSESVVHLLFRYGLAVVAVAAALALTLIIRRTTGSPTFFSFYIAIFVSIWFAGRGPGWLAFALASLLLHFFFFGPPGFTAFSREEIPTLLAFVLSGLTADVLSAQRNRAEEELRKAGQRLELTVQDRTAELKRTNEALLLEIADRKRIEEALRASEERWRRLFEASAAGMVIVDMDGRYVAANSAFLRMLGYTEAELKQRTAVDISHMDERARTEGVIADFAGGARQEYHVEKRYLKKDGTPVWVNVTTAYVPGSDSMPPLMQSVIIDIDDRKRAEAALGASEERWRTVFETASVGIATSDASRRILRANAALQRMLGYTEAELQAVGWDALTYEDDALLTDAWISDLIEGREQAFRAEKRYRRKDGELIWVNVSASYVPATEAAHAVFASIIVDITGRKRAEETLRQSQAELARVARVTTVGELGASIAHEINQPLAAIVASGNACQRWLENGQNLVRAKESLNRIISDANRASDVIKRIRTLTQRKPPEHLELEINQVIDDVLTFVRNELQAKNILVRRELCPGLPFVLGDRVQLQQVALNLIMNGIDAMAEITDRRRVLTVKSRMDERDSVLVTVQDSGAGLDPQHAELIFNAFFTTKPDGMGMGLAISTSIIEAHGGRLWVSPPVEHPGTAFHFMLPVVGGSAP